MGRLSPFEASSLLRMDRVMGGVKLAVGVTKYINGLISVPGHARPPPGSWDGDDGQIDRREQHDVH
jgi:hypothetical protein